MQPQEVAEEPAEPTQEQNAENASESVSRSIPDPIRRLLSTEGGQPVTEIETEYGVDKPVAFVVRGIMKVANSDGLPAVADIAVGIYLKSQQAGESASSSGNESDGGMIAGEE